MSASLLIQDTPMMVLPKLAGLIGLHEAIMLQQIHYLALRPSNRDGWVEKTLDDWCGVFTFMSQRTIERAFRELKQQRLLMSERVPGGSNRRRVRVDHEVLEALAELAETSRQSGGTEPPIWRDRTAKLAGPNRQIGGSRLCIEDGKKLKTEEPADAASQRRASTSIDAQIGEVFEAWQTATGDSDSPLDDKRRRIIAKALRSRPDGLAVCLDAVRGWRHSLYHTGQNPDKIPLHSISMLLGDADSVDRFSKLERIRGDSAPLASAGNVAGCCPGVGVDAGLMMLWAPIAAALAELIPADAHDIWLTSLHPHTELVDGTLIVGLRPEVATFVGARFREVLDVAAGDMNVTLVECELDTTRQAVTGSPHTEVSS